MRVLKGDGATLTLWICGLYFEHLFDHYDHQDYCKSDATICSATLESSTILLEVSFTLLDASFMIFIVQASPTIVTYDQ